MTMYAPLCFDVEDHTTPGRYGLDDIPLWMAEIMSEEQVIGSFLVIGEKARTLAARGRTDVIKAMRRHEIGSHTDNGSRHPTLCETLASLDWEKGVAYCRDKEVKHIRELERIFDTQVACLSRHGGNFAAQHLRAGAELGLPYLYSLASLAPHDPLWYCGGLSFGHELYLSERVYGRPAELTRAIAQLDAEIRGAADKGYACQAIFMAHPLMVKSLQFTDSLNYGDGVNRQPWAIPEFVPEKQVREARNGFRRMVRFLRDHDRLAVRPVSEIARRFGRRKPFLTREELLHYAGQAGRTMCIPDREAVSAAELILAWAEALTLKQGRIPARIRVRDTVLGPTEEPCTQNVTRGLAWGEIESLAARLLAFSGKSGHLPGNLTLDPVTLRPVGLGTLFFLFAKAVCALAVRKPARIKGDVQYPRYPEIAMEIDARARHGYLNWSVFDRNMPMDNLCRYARLQAWTCKVTR